MIRHNRNWQNFCNASVPVFKASSSSMSHLFFLQHWRYWSLILFSWTVLQCIYEFIYFLFVFNGTFEFPVAYQNKGKGVSGYNLRKWKLYTFRNSQSQATPVTVYTAWRETRSEHHFNHGIWLNQYQLECL